MVCGGVPTELVPLSAEGCSRFPSSYLFSGVVGANYRYAVCHKRHTFVNIIQLGIRGVWRCGGTLNQKWHVC